MLSLPTTLWESVLSSVFVSASLMSKAILESTADG